MTMGTKYTKKDRELLLDVALEGADIKVCEDTGAEYYFLLKPTQVIAHEMRVQTGGRLSPSSKTLHLYLRKHLFKSGIGYKMYGCRIALPPKTAPAPEPGPEAAAVKTVVTKDGRTLVLPSLENTDYLIALLENHKKELLNAI